MIIINYWTIPWIIYPPSLVDLKYSLGSIDKLIVKFEKFYSIEIIEIFI